MPRLPRISGGIGAACWLALILAAPIVTQGVDPAVLTAQANRVAMVEHLAPSVVAVFGAKGDGGGSGVLISPDGFALSNFHVTRECGNFMKCGLKDGVLYDAVIVGIDPAGDVALLKLLGRDDFPYAKLGDSDALRSGDWVYVMGNPFLLATDYTPTVTYGIVSGNHRYQFPAAGDFLEYPDCIQVDASINPGNSGGPLFNSQGELVGINGRGSFEKRGRVNVGVGYAISINQIKHFLSHLHSGRVVDHATLGATVQPGDSGSIIVDRVLERSHAYRRGLREGDEVVSFAGRPIGSVNQFKNVLGIYPDSRTLPLVFRRDGVKREIFVQLRSLHRESDLLRITGESESPMPHADPSAKAENPPPAPAQYKHLFEARPGYANYYFNRVHQQRLLTQLEGLGAWRQRTGLWQFTGQHPNTSGVFTIKLGVNALGMEIGPAADSSTRIIALQPLDGSDWLDEPAKSGGLLAAWHTFRLLLSSGPDAFGDVSYIGQEPIDGAGEMVDILQTSYQGLKSRWYFSVTGRTLVGWDTSREVDVDACEIRIDEWQQTGDRRFPKQFRVRCGNHDWGSFLVGTIEAAAAASTGGTP